MKMPRDSVAIAGSVIGLASIVPGWLTLKPNRLAAGSGLNLWDSLGWYGAATIIVLWLLCLVFSLLAGRKLLTFVLGIIPNLILVITFAFVGLASTALMQRESAFARVSPSAGFWFTLAGAFILIFAARQRLTSRLWRNLVSWSGIILMLFLLGTGWLNNLSVLQEFLGQEERFIMELTRHILLFTGSITVGVLIGVPLGIWAVQSRRADKPIFFIAGITQTIPSLALFGLLMAPLSALTLALPVLRDWGISGIGTAPAIIALIIYSLLPIVQNTYAGLRQVDPAAIEAGHGMGMKRSQVFRKVQIPLAAPVILDGIRTASVQAVGNTAVAALIGAGGLGQFIFQGLGQAASDLIILGAIPIILLALAVDVAMLEVVGLATPKGLKVHAT